MFLRIVDAYLIFKHSHQIANPFEVKINTDFVASSVEVKTHIYMAFLPALSSSNFGYALVIEEFIYNRNLKLFQTGHQSTIF